ncbi:MAG: glycosyltransferase [Prevotellaceae bacterium]|jgi:glycosyltransferase involved in cell wall biosynthesis|nr:glycosyltransferase [Prevotellaceae bacterium]
MFSVVIPLYNKAAYISGTINSVLNQTVGEFEIIVVDDGSTDKGPDIVRSFHDGRIRAVTQQNGGVSSARNAGIVESKYEYVALLDADDCWAPTFLEEISAMIDRYGTDMYATNYSVRQNGRLSGHRYTGLRTSQSISKWYMSHMEPVFFTSSVVIRKKIFEKTGMFDIRIFHGEDTDLWIRLASSCDIAYSEKPLVVYNRTPNSLATRKIDRDRMKRHLLSYTDKYDLSRPEVRHCVSLCQLIHGLYYYLFVDGGIFETYITRSRLWKFPLRFAIFYMIPRGCGRFLYRMYFNLK